MLGKNWEKSGNFEVDDKWQPWLSQACWQNIFYTLINTMVREHNEFWSEGCNTGIYGNIKHVLACINKVSLM